MKIFYKIITAILIFFSIYMLINYKLLEIKYNKIENERGILEENLKKKITIGNRKVEYVFKEIVGDTEVVKVVKEYVPVESKVVVNVDNNDNVKYNFKKYGFTLKPLINISINEETRFGLGFEWCYWNRFNISTGITTNVDFNSLAGYVSLNRRVDDFIPFFENTQIGLSFDSDKKIAINFSIFL